MTKLPNFLPQASWEPAPAGFAPVAYGSVLPPIQKHADGRLIVDYKRGADGSWQVAVFDNRDSPALAALPQHTPRAVKMVFRREWQLRFLRTTEGFSISDDIEAAHHAWWRFTNGKAA